jgi:Flp pilus assembly protein TadD
LAKLGEDEAADAALRHAHLLNPQDKGVEDLLFLTTLELGRKKLAAKEYAEGLKYFREAAQLKPVEASPHEGMVEVYAATGQAASAAKERSQAERLRKVAGAVN